MVEASNQNVTPKPWTESKELMIQSLGVDPAAGLSKDEVEQRQKKYGKNRLQTEKEKSALDIAIEQFKSLIILLLAVSVLLSFLFGDFVEGFAIIAVIIINAGIGFFTELRAVRSMEALKEMTQVTAKVRREGNINKINAREIVPGDVLVLTVEVM